MEIDSIKGGWEQHVRRLQIQHVRGPQSACMTSGIRCLRTRRMRFLRAELLMTLDCCQSHDCTAEWLRHEEAVWGGPESPSTEDACLRCWRNSDSPDGEGAARHWGCCHRTLVRARARDETPRRTADSFGGSVPKGEQGLRRMRHGRSGRSQSCLSRVLTAESTTCRRHHRSCESCLRG